MNWAYANGWQHLTLHHHDYAAVTLRADSMHMNAEHVCHMYNNSTDKTHSSFPQIIYA